ncbi:hypothetical protein [Nonomuraea endophytica]|uniref:hypothetical protein n=1 Tax=Nonomuraea endophytica TaxID=714136 RepID=UPI0037CA4BF5
MDTSGVRRVVRDTVLDAYDGRSRWLRTHPIVIATSRPGGAALETGANEAVQEEELATAIPKLFLARKRAAVERALGKDVPLPSRLLPVRVALPRPDAAKPLRAGPGPVSAAAFSLVAVGVPVAVSVLVAAAQPAPRPPSCGEGLEIVGVDCVGVSDGTGVFMPGVDGMRVVFAKIEAENARIAGLAHATVALMIPMESETPAVRTQILSEVQGAYLAQLQANAPDAAKPPIRLVLVNPGPDYRHWSRTVDMLIKREPNLRFVAGFNLSLENTQQAVWNLTNVRRIPVVGGLVTSGDMANPETQDRAKDPFPGLARVVSTAREQAEALLTFDAELAGAETALVADTRPKDNYNESLRAAFTEARKGKKGTGVQDMTFRSPDLEAPGITPNRFEDFALNICQSRARFVYFAGRGFHLELFVKKLASTYCSGKKSYTVISGSGATTLADRLDDAERELLKGDPGGGRPSVSIQYAAPAHPQAWDAEIRKWTKQNTRNGVAPGRDQLPRHLAEPQEALRDLRARSIAAKLGNVRLEDGRTIIMHDVVLTAAKALAKAVAVGSVEVPSAELVKEILADLNAAYRIRGASGWICLTSAGNPYDKAVAVVELNPAVKELAFKGIAWPEGAPPGDACVVPQD